ncbi:hypothetical protein MesoLjLc_59430 [Mesorhizobium sp. L-8-10]|uniref:DoxX family protein n=1 Tax=Mesorhizobium sp. L-8-10 TaxID=2744523 RepID=UPI00192854B1|nr:DoxX family protein [Mesorhizobium sp. L-8-10]BCH34013.1 hypothetical protein MesoLjLc_59430 [Mesorhizobium sp. L-8-10]
MPAIFERVLDSRAFAFLARTVLTFVFWSSGLAKLVDFEANAAVMESFNLHPGWAANAVTLVLQLRASAAIILNRGVWMASGALAVFTLLTIPIAHPFWAREGEEAFRDMTVPLEHVSLVGGLALAAALSRKS